jgi:hypothetical protein
MKETPVELYDIPIEELELSDETIAVVKRVGIISVGDCVDHFARIDDGPVMIDGLPIGFVEAMDEVKPRLAERGYYPHVLG